MKTQKKALRGSVFAGILTVALVVGMSPIGAVGDDLPDPTGTFAMEGGHAISADENADPLQPEPVQPEEPAEPQVPANTDQPADVAVPEEDAVESEVNQDVVSSDDAVPAKKEESATTDEEAEEAEAAIHNDAVDTEGEEASDEGADENENGSALELAGITFWGVDGDTITENDFEVAGDTVTVRTNKHIAVRTPDQTLHTSGNDAGRHVNPVQSKIVVPSGQTANILLSGIGLQHDDALDVQPGAVCHLVLADGSHNSFYTPGNESAIHNPTGATVTIDDMVPNKDASGAQITPEGGRIPRDMTLLDGRSVKKGDLLSVLDSANPGHLLALVTGVGNSSPFGGHGGQAGGTVTINGGNINIYNAGYAGGSSNCAAALGGGSGGGGTGLGEWITINGGRVDASSYKTGYGHGAAIGGGNAAYTGNIRINGGYTISTGGSHGSGFGAGCVCPDSSAYQIIITGGTLIPSSVESPYPGCGDIGAPGVNITITGGSIGNGRPGKPFNFVGSAHNAEGESLVMVEVDLTGDVGENTFPLTDWQLLVGNDPYAYGSPAEFDKGHLYLWLPRNVVVKNEVGVNFAYRDANGQIVEPTTLFRPAGDPDNVGKDNKLRRYVDFELPASYTDNLTKYYDGLPFATYDLETGPITTKEEPAKVLNDNSCVQVKYQRYDAVNGNPLGLEVTSDASGNPLTELPSDVGIVRFTLTSTQYSDNQDPAYAAFRESYWGHRASGWYEIKAIGSVVRDLQIEWVEDGTPGSVEHSADSELKVSAIIDRAPRDPEGNPTAATCKAPAGSVQLYADDEIAGEPIEIVFGEAESQSEARPQRAFARALRAAVQTVVPRDVPNANAVAVDNGSGGTYTQFSHVFTPAEADRFVPVATGDHTHTLSLRFLPGLTSQQDASAHPNYLESSDPMEGGDDVEDSVAAIEPLDPAATLEAAEDPDNADPNAPRPTVTTSADPTPAAPGADLATEPAKTYTGTIESAFGKPTADNPHPGRVILKIDSPSAGAFEVSGEDGPLDGADFVRDANGNPVRDENGLYTLIADPARAGDGTLKITQKANGAYTGTAWDYKVSVAADPTIAPEPSVSLVAENLTHPGAPAQPGDRIRYTLKAANAAAGSAWNDVALNASIPPSLKLDAASVSLGGKPLAAAPSGSAAAEGNFTLSDPASDGIRDLLAPAGTVWGGSDKELTFECVVADDAASRGTAASVAVQAQAQGTRADPAGSNGATLPVGPVESDPAYPGGTDKAVASDPKVSLAISGSKSSEGNSASVGERLTYKATLKNGGAVSSCLYSAAITDPLPGGVEFVPGTIRLTVRGQKPIVVPDAAYDPATRTIRVQCGDLWGGEEAVLTFDCKVSAGADDKSLANTVYAYGDIPSKLAGAPASEPEAGVPYVLAEGKTPVASSKPLALLLAQTSAGAGSDQNGAGADKGSGSDKDSDGAGSNKGAGDSNNNDAANGKGTSGKALPRTGDVMAATGGALLAAALVAAAVALGARRRAKANND